MTKEQSVLTRIIKILAIKKMIQQSLVFCFRLYHQKLKPMCSNLIFKRLLLKLTTGSIFIFNIKYYKQTGGFTMGGPLLVVPSDIYMTKLKKDAILPRRKQKLYKCFVGDIFTRRKTNVPDQLLKFLNNYPPNIKSTDEINPKKFLGTKIC